MRLTEAIAYLNKKGANKEWIATNIKHLEITQPLRNLRKKTQNENKVKQAWMRTIYRLMKGAMVPDLYRFSTSTILVEKNNKQNRAEQINMGR